MASPRRLPVRWVALLLGGGALAVAAGKCAGSSHAPPEIASTPAPATSRRDAAPPPSAPSRPLGFDEGDAGTVDVPAEELRALIAASESVDTRDVSTDTGRLPGFSEGHVLRLSPPIPSRDNFIHDAEDRNGTRASLLLDARGDLVFRARDTSHSASVRIHPGPASRLAFGDLVTLFCEYGSTADSSVLRVIADGRVVGETRTKPPLRAFDLEGARHVAGADISGRNGAVVDLGDTFLLARTTGAKQRADLLARSARRATSGTITLFRFTGTEWLGGHLGSGDDDDER